MLLPVMLPDTEATPVIYTPVLANTATLGVPAIDREMLALLAIAMLEVPLLNPEVDIATLDAEVIRPY